MTPVVLIVLACSTAAGRAEAATIPWRLLEPGLELAELTAPVPSDLGDSVITVVRIDPRRRRLRLLMASEQGGGKRTARTWARQHRLAVAANAGMFEAYGDQSTSHHYMKSFAHVNNPALKADNAFLVFDPVDDSVPPFQIIDRKSQDFAALWPKYQTIVQGIRMISRAGRNTWAEQPRRWSMVIAAMDQQGRLLFIFTRSPYTVHAFIDLLLDLPLELSTTMYLEGGPEASLVVTAGSVQLERFGSYETDFFESDDNDHLWPIPNLLGVEALVPPAP